MEVKEDRAPKDQPPLRDNTRLTVIAAVIAIALACAVYKVLVASHLEQTSALFIGIPTILAIVIVLTPRPQSATGAIVRATAIALCLSGILLGEGFICIVMAAPLFLMVAVLIGTFVDFIRLRRQNRRGPGIAGLILLIFGPQSLEGVTERTSFSREQAVTVSRVVDGTADAVEERLGAEPRFTTPLPPYFRIGFPRPTAAAGSGLSPGDRRTIHFSGGEGHPGDLVLKVVDAGPGRVRFAAVSDDSHIAHWLTWREAEVRWRSVDGGRVRIDWTLRYRRDLDPAWYFGPWERYAAHLAAAYLIENLGIPRPG